MVEATQYLSRLNSFAESFTGFPVRILVPSHVQTEEDAQTEGLLKIFIPRTVEPRGKNNLEIALKIYKGLVALQASAMLYKGMQTTELKERITNKLREATAKNMTLDNLVVASVGTTELLPACFNVIELSRRMACIRENYPVLAEDMEEGFQDQFSNYFLNATSKNTNTTNEVDLALTRVLWENLGIKSNLTAQIVRDIPLDENLGSYRQELYELARKVSSFNMPLRTTVEESIERVISFKEYLDHLSKDLDIGSFFIIASNYSPSIGSRKDLLNRQGLVEIQRERIEKTEIRKKELERLLTDSNRSREIFGDHAEDIIVRRIAALKAKREKIEQESPINIAQIKTQRDLEVRDYSQNKGTVSSLDKIFKEIPKKQLVELEAPKSIETQGGQIIYLPEVRTGILVSRGVRAAIYDLNKDLPLPEEQRKRGLILIGEIGGLQRQVEEATAKIESDVNYIYNLSRLQKDRDSTRRRISKLKMELKNSQEIHAGAHKAEISIDQNLIRRIEIEMEKIKPQARTIVRNCFEGELDEKRYFDYLLETQRGGSPLPNFYYQWQKRRRDVATVVLIDASNSTDKLAIDNKTILDVVKESAFYLIIGAEKLEDKTAVVAYNGRGNKDLRLYLLKNFNDDLDVFRERLQQLRPELNNRDGAAIRYASSLLNQQSAKTKFLFHVSDMNPSDIEYEFPGATKQIQSFPYQGAEAVEDVVSAFNYSRGLGIVPVGICIRVQPTITSATPLSIEKINPAVLAKLKKQKGKDLGQYDERLTRSFRANYRAINDVKNLPQAMRDAYIRLSFR